MLPGVSDNRSARRPAGVLLTLAAASLLLAAPCTVSAHDEQPHHWESARVRMELADQTEFLFVAWAGISVAGWATARRRSIWG